MSAIWIVMIAVFGTVIAVLAATMAGQNQLRGRSGRRPGWLADNGDAYPDDYEDTYIGAPRPYRGRAMPAKIMVKLGLLLMLGFGGFFFLFTFRSGGMSFPVILPLIILVAVGFFAVIAAVLATNQRRLRDSQVRLVRKRRKPKPEELAWEDDAPADEYIYLDELADPADDVPLESLLNPPDDDDELIS